MAMIFKNKILSIQSHVVSGYVGNKCCILPLQLLGNEVDFINTVQLNNHTGYKFCKGQILSPHELKDLYDGLKLNNLANYSYLIIGYIGSKTLLEEVYKIIIDIKQSKSFVKFYCDPVMGDNGKMYVPDDSLDVYRDKILSLADVLFPNQYEIELLTKKEIKCEEEMIEAMEILHKIGIKMVVVTSSNIGPENLIFGYVSNTLHDGSKQRLRMEIPKLSHNFSGTGDLFASLFLAWSLKYPNNLKVICSKVIGSIQIVLRKSVERLNTMIHNDINAKMNALELNLVDSILDLLNPEPFDDIFEILK